MRVIAPDVGGGFGAKIVSSSGLTEEIIVAWLARELGRPMRWTETRSESMLALPHGRAMRLSYTIGGTKDGKVLAYKLDILADCGAYPTLGAILAEPDHADVERRIRHPPDRGRGNDGGHEHDADRGLPRRRPARGDPGDRVRDRPVRRRDRHGSRRGPPPELRRRVPAQTAVRRELRLGRLRPARSTSRCGPPATRSCAPSRSGAATRRRRSSSVSASPPTSRSRTRSARASWARSRCTGGGEAIVRTGSFSHGQGHETSFAMVVADRLGLPLEKVTVHKGDTDEVAVRHGHVRLEVAADRRHGLVPQPRRPSSSRRSRSSPTTWRRTRRTSSSTRGSAASTSPAPPTRRCHGRSWRRARRATAGWRS